MERLLHHAREHRIFAIMNDIARNTSQGFARFGLKNLEFIEQCLKDDLSLDVHPVTQLVLSLLGVIVFQHADHTIQNNPNASDAKLSSLDSQWTTSPPCDTVGQLVEHLRHAVAHGHVKFSSASHNYHDVSIYFSNNPKSPTKWTGSIRADSLQKFCYQLMKLLFGSSSAQVDSLTGNLPFAFPGPPGVTFESGKG
jgi:hypothetical protein